MQWAGAREWLAYLIGEFKNDNYYIYDLYLPDQRTCSTLVDKVIADKYNEMKVVGVIHSHHEMGAGDEDRPSFSGHDEAFINSNHNLSLLAGRDRTTKGFKIVGIARTKTPCGAFMKIKASVKAMNEIPSDAEKEMKKEFLEKTQTQTRTRTQIVQNNTSAVKVTQTTGGKRYHYNSGNNCYPANQFNGNQNYVPSYRQQICGRGKK
jgi:hypothetical protein